jgi:acid phosphatase
VGPNATALTNIYALNSSDPASWTNSLAPSDLCKAYNDESGSPYIDVWNKIYLPPIQSRLNAKIHGNFTLTQSDVALIPYLCGFETQITGNRSPFCDVFKKDEVLDFEYAQDLRYWYGTGLGSDIEKYQMLPILDMVVQRFVDGPNKTYKTGNSTYVPPKVMVTFSNDGQINQLAAALGVFDDETQLPGDKNLPKRKFRSSAITCMRGTIAFERLSCSASGGTLKDGYPTSDSPAQAYMRIRINDVAYPVVGCTGGPGSSCPLSQYQSIVKGKLSKAGSFTKLCNVTNPAFSAEPHATFFMDNKVPFAYIIKP